MSLLDWVNHGLLTIFFIVVGLEIKREFTVGHLATFRSGALPVVAALGGIVLPAVIYASIAPPELRHGWGIPIGTDTAFAVALIVLLGDRVPVELRVFLTAAVIIDDIVAILVIALFYTGEIHTGYLIAGGAVTALLVVLNRAGVYGALPYAVCGVVLWFFLHEAGLHATLAGVILAVLIPTRPPANLNALLAQAATVIHLEDRHAGEAMRPGPSEPALRTLDAIHARIESPADKLLRSVEPWSSYVVLPIFALANAGVAWSLGVFEGHGRLMLAIALGLVLGKPIGIVLAAWLAVRRRHRGEARRVFVAPVVRRRRARRHRLHDVAVHRGRGLPRPGRLRRRQDRHLPRLADRRRAGRADPVAETRSERRARDRRPVRLTSAPGLPSTAHRPGRTTSEASNTRPAIHELLAKRWSLNDGRHARPEYGSNASSTTS